MSQPAIVILCHNQQHLTMEAIGSLRATMPEPYTLLVVDNGSTDGTKPYLLAEHRWRGDTRLILHGRNLGFPGGMNSALRYLAGTAHDPIVLCNNDLVFSEHWFAPLARTLADETVGLTGPCTNLCGNEAMQPDAKYGSMDGMQAYAARRARKLAGQTRDLPMLGFFCVAGRRDVWQEIGEFDETFNPGYFEDDDYCIRTRRAGYRLVLTRDSYVHHAHEGTFRSMDKGVMGQVIAHNRCYFESKWGVTWTGDQGRYDYIDEAVRKPAIALAGTA